MARKFAKDSVVDSSRALSNSSKSVRFADLSLMFVALLWGAGFIAVQFAIKSGMPTSLILALRFSIGAAVVFAAKFKTILKLNKKELINGAIAGTILFLSFFMQTLGQIQTGVSNSAFITAVYVVIVPFIIWIVKRKPPKLKMFILVFTTLIGVIILTYTKGSLFSFSSGDIYLLLCAVGFAGHIVFLGTKTRDINPTRITFIQLATAAILGSTMFFSTEQVLVLNIDWNQGLFAILYVGIFSTAVCYFLQTWAQTITSPSKAAIIMSAESLFGSLFAIIIAFEIFKFNIIIGGFIILSSVVLSEIEFKRRKREMAA